MRTDRRLVIDTNLWISRLLVPGGTAARAADHGLSWGIPLMSEETLTELSEVLSRARFDRYVSREDRQHFLRLLGGIVRVIPITQRIAACRDPEDDKFLDVALNGEAHLILTGDQDLLELHPFHGIEINSPADFLRLTP
ncbi:MAG TPA: putative toxin-antitoxin system toxin component, PIN family [Gammaproteobacteria bacterium]|nr:putative toxin-antitoxin system toxin component, PIN family [Gammaproteobacteria bacterium]